MDEHLLPFKVGQFVELRSFEDGYRGAWFRCEIAKIHLMRGEMWHRLKYRDYPDEKVGMVKVVKKSKWSKSQIMVRPCFPPLYCDGQMPDISTISEVVVIANDVWKVGDLVDWWADGCYWSGRLTDALGNEKFQVELFPPPVGEGATYEALSKDLRPSLEWSPECGWTVPIPTEGHFHPCAWLLKPETQASSMGTPNKMKSTTKEPLNAAASKEKQTLEKMDTDLSPEARENDVENDGHDNCGPSKQMEIDAKVPSNYMISDSMEAAILDLEELINKVKWMKDMLESGTSLSSTRKAAWKFVEHNVSSKPK